MEDSETYMYEHPHVSFFFSLVSLLNMNESKQTRSGIVSGQGLR